MLVDNAIVVSDSALVNMQRGMRKRVAIMRACSSTALALLAATIIAILTFLPIYYSPHITDVYKRQVSSTGASAAAFSAASAAFFSASAFAFTSLIFFSPSRRALASAFLASSC